uniref:Uncharacterized protein n=1 Tax=Ralstonia solanacearum TaxID=305 RepID=A0A0S4TWA1_RALSL|nr:protein of unknown function [Ralstonia solanacearum]
MEAERISLRQWPRSRSATARSALRAPSCPAVWCRRMRRCCCALAGYSRSAWVVAEYIARIDGEGRKRPIDQVKRRDPARQACASGRQAYSHTPPDISIVMLEVGWTRLPWEPKDRAGHQSTTPSKRFPLHCSGGNVR